MKCPDCAEGILELDREALVTERYAPAIWNTAQQKQPWRSRRVTIAACNGCETILEFNPRTGEFVRSAGGM